MAAIKPTPIDLIAIAVQANVPVLAWGPPGVGKSSAIMALADKLDRHLEVVISSLREPTDLAGIPYNVAGELKLSTPAWAKRIMTHAGPSILFLDEITTCAPAVQAALLRVIFERVVGDVHLPPSCAIVAAANPPEIAAGGWDLAPPMLNRFFHVDWTIDPIAWSKGFVEGFPIPSLPKLPSNWESRISLERQRIAAFIRTKPKQLNPELKDAFNVRAFATPRSWDMAARLIAAADAAGFSIDYFATGTIGKAVAMEYLVARQSIPSADYDISRLLTQPSLIRNLKFENSEQLSQFLDTIVTHIVSQMTESAINSGWHILHEAYQHNGKRMDIVVGAGVKLLLNTPVDPRSFTRASKDFNEFANLIYDHSRKWHGLK